MGHKSINGDQVLAGPTSISVSETQQADSDLSKISQSFANSATEGDPYHRMTYSVNNYKDAVISWRLPNGSAVQMYVNPENIDISENKNIVNRRVKGGYLIQYWGEELTQITLSGTTGSSGVVGVNILRDIYRSENRGFDVIAAQLQNEVEDSSQSLLSGESTANYLQRLAVEKYNRQFLLRPSLASLAASVIMFYQGVQYKGFFKSFTVRELASKLGLFDYTMVFMATETRGRRKNFLAWHKEPMADDFAGQLINGVGNSLRSALGLANQPPESFSPATAPYTFGGNSVSSGLGLTNQRITQNNTIFL